MLARIEAALGGVAGRRGGRGASRPGSRSSLAAGATAAGRRAWGGGREKRNLQVHGDRGGGHGLTGRNGANDEGRAITRGHTVDQGDRLLTVRAVVLDHQCDLGRAKIVGGHQFIVGQLDGIDDGCPDESEGARVGEHDANLDFLLSQCRAHRARGQRSGQGHPGQQLIKSDFHATSYG